MIKVTKLGVVLSKTELGFENAGVLNPAIIAEGKIIHLFYRAVRKGNYSTIGYCRLDSPTNVAERFDIPVLFPQAQYETHGVEDPRISKIEGVYYMTYTAYDGVNALGAYATSETLPYFEKKGILTSQITYEEFRRLAESKVPLNEKYNRYNALPNAVDNSEKKILLWDKNIVFFPRRIMDKLCFLHRIKPDIQFVSVNDMGELSAAFWQDYFMHYTENIVLQPKYPHEISYVGAGCPPIETPYGWLLIYHGVHDTTEGYKYVACAALLDLDNPEKEITRLSYPLFSPDLTYEMNGEVNNVCFPTGTALINDTLYIYYGAADQCIACASLSLKELLIELVTNTKDNE